MRVCYSRRNVSRDGSRKTSVLSRIEGEGQSWVGPEISKTTQDRSRSRRRRRRRRRRQRYYGDERKGKGGDVSRGWVVQRQSRADFG